MKYGPEQNVARKQNSWGIEEHSALFKRYRSIYINVTSKAKHSFWHVEFYEYVTLTLVLVTSLLILQTPLSINLSPSLAFIASLQTTLLYAVIGVCITRVLLKTLNKLAFTVLNPWSAALESRRFSRKVRRSQELRLVPAIGPFRRTAYVYRLIQTLSRMLRRIVCLSAILVCLIHWKHASYFFEIKNADVQHWQFDRMLHLGAQPTYVLIELISSMPTLHRGVTTIYQTSLFALVAIMVFFMLEIRRSEISKRYFIGVALVGTFCGSYAFVMPSVGPRVASTRMEASDNFYLSAELKLRAAPHIYFAELRDRHRRAFLQPGRYQSVLTQLQALPALNCAMSFTSAFFLWRLSRQLGTVGLISALVIFVGSVYSGDRYAVDGYIGMLIAAFVTGVVLNYPKPVHRLKIVHRNREHAVQVVYEPFFGRSTGWLSLFVPLLCSSSSIVY